MRFLAEQARNDRIEQLLYRIAGHEVSTADRDAWHAFRLETARMGKARRPFFLVQDLGTRGNVSSGTPLQFPIPNASLGFRGLFDSGMTDLMSQDIGMNIVETKRDTGGEVTTRYTMSQTHYPFHLFGDMNVGNNRVGVPDWYPSPEPWIVEAERSAINLQVQRIRGSLADISNTYMVFRGVKQFEDRYQEAQFTGSELASINSQIARTEPEVLISVVDIDYTNVQKYQNVEIVNENSWLLLLGFQSALEWSTVDITEDPWQHEWSTDPIPITALANPVESASDSSVRTAKLENYRSLMFPYLIPPNKPLVATFAKRDATGAGAYPPNMLEADIVKNGLAAAFLRV